MAQLGERLNGIQEAGGSIPLTSTRKSPEIVRFQDFSFIFIPESIVLQASYQNAYQNCTRIAFESNGLVATICYAPISFTRLSTAVTLTLSWTWR